MPTLAVRRSASPSAVADLRVRELAADLRGVLIPRPEVHVVARLGGAARGGLDIHVMGARQTVRRKQLRSGQRVVSARLHLGATEAVLGANGAELAGRIVALEELWGDSATRRLFEQLAEARSASELAAVLDAAIAERSEATGGRRPATQLVLSAAERLTSASVNTVATDLGVSERHLRRVFQETLGLGPKAFAQLTRFRRAVGVARRTATPCWATIAVGAGYYDQAHLIGEFRTIAGVTPRALLSELHAAPAMD